MSSVAAKRLRTPAISRQSVAEATLKRIDEFQKLTGLSDAQIGQRALKDTKFIPRLRSGMSFNMNTIDKLNAWLEDNLRRTA